MVTPARDIKGGVAFGRRYGRVPLDFFDLLPTGGYAGAALPVYLALEGFADDVTRLAFPLVCTACQRIGMSDRTWMGATATLKSARLILKGGYQTHRAGTIAYKVKPIEGRWVEVEGEREWQDDDWTMLNTDLAWERFSGAGWRLLLRLAYHDKRALKVAEWAAEAGVGSSQAHAAMAELVASGWVENVTGGKRNATYQAAPELVSGPGRLALIPGIGRPYSGNWHTDRDLSTETGSAEDSSEVPSELEQFLESDEVVDVVVEMMAKFAARSWFRGAPPVARARALTPEMRTGLRQVRLGMEAKRRWAPRPAEDGDDAMPAGDEF